MANDENPCDILLQQFAYLFRKLNKAHYPLIIHNLLVYLL